MLPLSRRALLVLVKFNNKTSCACTWPVKEHNINPEYEVGMKPT